MRSRQEYLSSALEAVERSQACQLASSLTKEVELGIDYLWQRSREMHSLKAMRPYLLLGKVAAHNSAKVFEKLETRRLRQGLLAGIFERFGDPGEERLLANLHSKAFGEMWIDVWSTEKGGAKATLHWDEVLYAEKIYGQNREDAIAIGEIIEHCIDVTSRRCLKREIRQWYWVDTSDPSSLVRRQQEVRFNGQAKPALLEMLSDELKNTSGIALE